MTVFGLLFSGTSLVVADDYSLPNIEQHANDIVVSEQDGQRWITRSIDPDHATTTYPTHQLLPLRLLLTQWDSVAFERASRALQLLDWSRTHQHCGCCGTAMQPHATGEMAQVCPACAHTAYPRINPCVIVAIRRDNTILLARAQRFTVPMFSLIAGFVEVGETLEQAVHREVLEEVGIKIHNLHYMGSQPWPFPSNLMIGFTAEYLSGELVLQEDEIAEADYFPIDQLPLIPPQGSIAHSLVQHSIDAIVAHQTTTV
jgi:NAD+ diphosphatase